MRQTLAINEASFGKDHPDVATALNNLARLLQATNHLAEAGPLMRRTLEVFVKVTRATGHPHPDLESVLGNYHILLEEMGDTQAQVADKLNDLLAPAGLTMQQPAEVPAAPVSAPSAPFVFSSASYSSFTFSIHFPGTKRLRSKT